VVLDGGAQHRGEPHRVRAADEPGAGQEPGPVIDDAGQVAGPAGHVRAVHQVRGPDLVHRVGLEPAERLWRLPAGPCDKLAGREPALDRPVRGRPAEPGDQDPADLGRGPGRVLELQPDRELDHVRAGARRALARLGHQRLEPAVAARDHPAVQGAPRHRDLLPAVRPVVLAGGQIPDDPPRCRGVRAGSIAGPTSVHRHSAISRARCRRAAASRSAAVMSCLLEVPGS